MCTSAKSGNASRASVRSRMSVRSRGNRANSGRRSRRAPTGRLWTLAAVDEVIEHPYAELERVNRHPLVHAVEHAEEVKLGRQAQRRVPEAADADPAERLRIGPAGQAVRHNLGGGVRGQDGGRHGVAQRAVELGLDSDVMVDELPLHTGPEQAVQLGEELIPVPRHEAAVHIRGCQAWDHVYLVARVKNGGVGRVGDRGPDHAGQRPELLEHLANEVSSRLGAPARSRALPRSLARSRALAWSRALARLDA